MPGQHPPISRKSSIASVDTTASQTSCNAAAFVGATTAFGRPAPVKRGSVNVTNRTANDGGALAAASMVTTAPQRALSKSPGGIASNGSGNERAVLDIAKTSNLLIPPQDPVSQNKSPSQQAAYLAASRAHSAPRAKSIPLAKAGIIVKARDTPGTSSLTDANCTNEATDRTSMPATNALVDLFERRRELSSSSAVPRPYPLAISNTKESGITSPKPLGSGITSMIRMELEEARQHGQHGSGVALDEQVTPNSAGGSSNDSFASAAEDLASEHLRTVPPRNRSLKASRTIDGISAVSRQDTSRAPLHTKRRFSSVSPVRQTFSKAMPIRQPSQSTIGSHEYAPSSVQSARSIQAQFKQQHPRRRTPLTTGDQLANALVASSLASSRAPSPTRLEPPPGPGHRKKGHPHLLHHNHNHHHHHHHHTLGFSRTPSPAKTAGMLQTLRPQHDSSASESDDDLHPYRRHKKKRLVRKHPNKHHEGDRKRWREAVTERERKRYEGVWAANRGMLYSFTLEEQELFRSAPNDAHTRETKAAAAEQVSNIVTREIWSRSRLPESTLEMVWDLVDQQSIGRLSKVEFVVGLWLIDQRLKGRKLPVKVSDSVWTSVRGLEGIKIRR